MSVWRCVVCGVYAAFIVFSPSAVSAQELSQFDTFSGPLIDPIKWLGVENTDDEGGQPLESVRQISAGQLALVHRAMGDYSGNVPVNFLGTGIGMMEPGGVTELVFDAKVASSTATGCPGNSAETVSGIVGGGAFYREDTVQTSGGDLVAFIGIGKRSGRATSSNRVEVFGIILSDHDNDIIITDVVDLGTVLKANTHKLRIAYHPESDEISFRVNNRPIVRVDVPPAIDPPNEDFKVVQVLNAVASCNLSCLSPETGCLAPVPNPAAVGHTSGTVDNVSITRVP